MKKFFKNLFTKEACTATFTMGSPKNLTATALNADGFAIFNLYTNNDAVLSGLDITQYTVGYYESEETARANTTPLEDASAYYNMKPFNETIYVRVTDKTNPAEYAIASFSLYVRAKKQAIAYELIF